MTSSLDADRIVRPRRSGYSLIELMMVLAILGILVALALPRQTRTIEVARLLVTQANLRSVLVAEIAWHAEHGTFTSAPSDLLEMDPALPVYNTADPIGSVRISVNWVEKDPENGQRLCLFAEAAPGEWFAMYHSPETGTMYGRSRPQSCTAEVATDFHPGNWSGAASFEGNGRLIEQIQTR